MVTEIQLTSIESSKLKVQAMLSPIVVVVTSHKRRWCQSQANTQVADQRQNDVPGRRHGGVQNPSGGITENRRNHGQLRREFCNFSRLRSMAFRTLAVGKDGMEMTSIAWASDRYQSCPKWWPDNGDPTGSRLRVGLTRFNFSSLSVSFSSFSLSLSLFTRMWGITLKLHREDN